MSDKTCPAVLTIAGQHFPCDWITPHEDWAHANTDAQAIWSDGPEAAS